MLRCPHYLKEYSAKNKLDSHLNWSRSCGVSARAPLSASPTHGTPDSSAAAPAPAPSRAALNGTEPQSSVPGPKTKGFP